MSESSAVTSTARTTSTERGHRWSITGRRLAWIRIAFGVVWAIDASFKWQPGFIHQFSGDVTGAEDGQPRPIKTWIAGWGHIVHSDPHLFAYLLAVAETVLAVTLLLGVFTNAVSVLGAVLSLLIWSTAEGFGGPYQAGATDIGASIIYVLVWATLLAGGAGAYLGLDARIRPWLAGSRFSRAAWLSSRQPDAA